MRLVPPCSRILSLATAACLVLPATGLAQIDENLWPSMTNGASVWAQSIGVKQSSGSVELGTIDMGPPGPPISGLQSTWIEWNQLHAYAAAHGSFTLSGSTPASSVEIFDPFTGLALQNCLGAAALNGGYVITYSGGSPASLYPEHSAFVWTNSKLYVVRVGPGVTVLEVTKPSGASMNNVLGVAVIHSFIYDYSSNPMFVSAMTHASALVYTPSNVYIVDAVPGSFASALEVLSPTSGLPLTNLRGVGVVAGQMDFTSSPPIDVQGAAFLWDPGHVYYFTKTPSWSISEVFTPGGAPMNQCWGVMRIGPGLAINPIRTAAQIWQTSQAWYVSIDPVLTLHPMTQPPGGPFDSAIVTNTFAPVSGTPLIERQAAGMYEILGTMLVNGVTRRAIISGQTQSLRGGP